MLGTMNTTKNRMLLFEKTNREDKFTKTKIITQHVECYDRSMSQMSWEHRGVTV